MLVIVGFSSFQQVSPTPEAPFEPIARGTGFDTSMYYWTVDSQNYIYLSIEWEIFNVPNQSWTTSDSWPIQMTPSEKQQFSLSGVTDGRDSLVFESPDHHYLAYTAFVDNDQVLAVANRRRGIKQTLEDVPSENPDSLDGFKVLWSKNSRAFIALLRSDEGWLFGATYVGNITDDLGDLDWTDLNSSIQAELTVKDVYGLSATGDKALLLTVYYDPNKPMLLESAADWRLMIWDSVNPQASYLVSDIDGKQVLAAAFDHYDANHLLVLTQTGLVEKFIREGRTYHLNFPFTAKQILSANFSPDGSRMAVVVDEGDLAALYLFDVPHH